MELRLQRLDDTESNIQAVQKLLEATPTYCLKVSGQTAGAEDGKEVFLALPDNFKRENKHTLGIYQQDQLVGLIDCLIGYPSAERAYLGLLLIDESLHGQGIGQRTCEQFEKYLINFPEIEIIRLAVVRSNETVLPFWKKMGFNLTGEVKPYSNKTMKSESLLMEKLIGFNKKST